ncbi:D-Ala-D-Ala carboxypeptidase family metallohydrolase [Priestia flexa]|uniref:D-Ala-D-Ala carboxypeptidase family metallohydrolase n=1 Tax=Priestia flexa TaxID=86664 RepID=UPI00047426AF|nr:D-Ala-D-Ala carboxypeptidase family metallohydrolase [Priestia flexa]
MAVDKATYGIKQNNSSKTAIDIAKQYGLTLTSGYRSPSKNASIGGSKTSFHTHGLAYDFAGTPSQMQKFAEWAKTSGLYSEVIYNNGDHKDHVHVGWGEKTPYYDVKNSSSTGSFNGVDAVSTEGTTTSDSSTGGSVFGSMLGGIIRVSSIIILIIFAVVFFLMAFPNTQQVLKTGGKLLNGK